MRYFHLQRCDGLAVLPDDAINPDQLVQASLPPEQSRSFVALMLERNPEDVETRLDCVRRRDVVSVLQRLAAVFSIVCRCF